MLVMIIIVQNDNGTLIQTWASSVFSEGLEDRPWESDSF